MQAHVREEEWLAIEGDAARDADEAYSAARARGANRLQHRFLRADALEDGVSAHTLRQFLDACHALIAALGDDVGGAELARERLARRMAAHRDDAFGAHLLR